MEKKHIKLAAAAIGLALAVSGASMPFDTAAAAGTPVVVKETAWTHAMKQLPEMTKVVHERHVIALAAAKEQLQTHVTVADELFESSNGKAALETRRLLAAERNRANTLVMFSDDENAPAVEQARLIGVVETVQAEVTAWEEAEAARIAEEARLAEEARIAEQARAAAATHKSSGRKGSAAAAEAAGQTPQQYLEGIASSYGASISWTDSPCGRAASGCYQGGSTLYVSNAMYSSWDKAKGRGRNVVVHEASHMIIQNTCGTVLLGGSRFENVTDAYTVLLGAGQTGYGYDDNDMALASAAIGGQCLEG